ncbi:unnamed protein product [Gongylonema pulchrum]|uniref:Tyrosine-protein phosphatase domain-containing protein n=1 Tax=Gongylonema pulchrum TaxID=637853 RepID=A0A183CY03_9BILA|nr:unnamed protein product [Gongylonema pulchrum]
MENSLEWAKSICRNGLRPLLREFTTVRKYIPKDITTDYFDQNATKNRIALHTQFRYTDVMCIDSTRVVLQGRSKKNNYIHANWVRLPSSRRYICTQGPLDETVEDFWLMIFKVIF